MRLFWFICVHFSDHLLQEYGAHIIKRMIKASLHIDISFIFQKFGGPWFNLVNRISAQNHVACCFYVFIFYPIILTPFWEAAFNVFYVPPVNTFKQ